MALLRDDDGALRMGRLITVLGCIALSGVFVKEASTETMLWQDYIAYSVSMTIMYAPAKAIDLINAIKGKQ